MWINLTVVLFSSAIATSIACPTECSCFGWVGEMVVDCARRGLNSVPYTEFPADATEIHLQYNNIDTLDAATFNNVPNLKHLYLQSNRITNIPDGLFDKLPELETLRINDNQISDIGSAKFAHLQKLILLYVHNNRLEAVNSDAFSGLDLVKQISVAGNRFLKNIDYKAFDLANITMIDISGSSVASITPPTLLTGRSLEKVYMYDIDTLICDDTILELIQWMNRNPLIAFGRSTMLCAEPENLRGKSLLAVNEDNIVEAGSCPTECSCFSGIVDCSSRNWTSVPENFAPETTEIFLQNNQIEQLANNDLVHLANVEFLHLHDNMINFWDINSFSGPRNTLRQLTVNNNQLTSIPAGVFTGMRKLEVLNLNDNQIRMIRSETFADLVSLVQLSINNNGLATIASDAFLNLMNLKYLGLASNDLSAIPDNLLMNSGQLYFFDFSGNELNELPKIPSSASIIVARETRIKSLTASSFENAEALEELDVSHNTIYIVEKNAFAGAPKLYEIDLSHNTIEEINDETFSSAPSLVAIDLSYNNRLERVTDGAFVSPRKHLRVVYLNNCNIKTMTGKVFSVVEDSRFYATLGNNPWNCDCNLENLADFINSDRSAVADEADAKCATPPEELDNPLHEVDYDSNCAIQVPEDEDKALIISLSIVGAFLIVLVVTGLMIWNSKKNYSKFTDSNSLSGSKSVNVHVEAEDPKGNGNASHSNEAFDGNDEKVEHLYSSL